MFYFIDGDFDERYNVAKLKLWKGMCKMIRCATLNDASRIAEILIFTKRVNYRKIFQNDKVSFGDMQVYPLASEYINHPDKLENIYVYDDEFVKGMIHIDGTQIVELYVDTFFENQGIGSKLVEYVIEQMNCDHLWVLEKNIKAIQFYEKHGFVLTHKKQFEDGTTEMIIQMHR